MTKTFTLMGFTVANAEQARSVLMVAKLKGYSSNSYIVQQCIAVIRQFEAA